MLNIKLRSLKTLSTSLCAAVLLSASAAQVQAAETFRMSTLGPGSSPYMVMTHFANTVNKALPEYSIIVNATGVAPKHALDTSKGRGEFFMMSPSIHSYMKTGGGMFGKIKQAPELAQNLRAVFMFPMGLYQGVTYADDNIHSLKDLKGKRVFAGPPGGVSRRTVETMIRAATGYEPGEDYTSVKLGHESASQAFQDHNIDVYFNATVAPSPVISQIALTNQVRFIGVDMDTFNANPALQKLLNTPGYSVKTLEPGVYGENQVNTDPVYTIGINVGIATHKDLDEETIYNMTKAYWDGIEAQKASTPWLRNLNLDGVFADMNMPMHPGAMRYFQEIGLDVPEVK
ncbi:MAG: TAXI family TRAP transporter solute-binding subunit [Oceanospirillales bacterium]|uniref:TRAP transporter TAXI family solute receptor n=1 Tax=Marinobacterium halophilum TaxID=267374 RepID=A0A2P8F329_9GAMM|nr:TAXI family TRAP transporter solute-binding subunit [Marinobacterium halophilum]MBR9829923.1 TAXI family TRAP transporter solute-binding subunit [Oceanospirillales bacterium]PSL16124.1 hypothetical protein CLV44_10247 [Marinobacterium halophilum]